MLMKKFTNIVLDKSKVKLGQPKYRNVVLIPIVFDIDTIEQSTPKLYYTLPIYRLHHSIFCSIN